MNYEALAIAEVWGSCNVITVMDQMCKTADVEYCMTFTKYGGLNAVIMTGKTSAAQAAVEGLLVNPPCEVVKAVVITRPSRETIKILEDEMKISQHFRKLIN